MAAALVAAQGLTGAPPAMEPAALGLLGGETVLYEDTLATGLPGNS